MATNLRNQLKTHARRASEALLAVALKSGGADNQTVISGCVVAKGGAGPNQQVVVSAGSFVSAAALFNVAAVAATSLPGGATTDAATFRNVLVEISPAGALSFVVGNGAASALLAVTPAGVATNISLAVIALPPSFTVGTTALTDAMITQVVYDAG